LSGLSAAYVDPSEFFPTRVANAAKVASQMMDTQALQTDHRQKVLDELAHATSRLIQQVCHKQPNPIITPDGIRAESEIVSNRRTGNCEHRRYGRFKHRISLWSPQPWSVRTRLLGYVCKIFHHLKFHASVALLVVVVAFPFRVILFQYDLFGRKRSVDNVILLT
jgi:hypothetical protein